jgi:hypothetical protein
LQKNHEWLCAAFALANLHMSHFSPIEFEQNWVDGGMKIAD